MEKILAYFPDLSAEQTEKFGSLKKFMSHGTKRSMSSHARIWMIFTKGMCCIHWA